MFNKQFWDELKFTVIGFAGIVVIGKMFMKEIFSKTQNIVAGLVLVVISVVMRHALSGMKDKYSINDRNYELIRRLMLLAIISIYIYIVKGF